MSTLVLDKKADLAGPGIGDYKELEKILPNDYHSLLNPRETQQAIFHVKRYIEDNLCKELNLIGRGAANCGRRERCQRHA
jgi:aspartate--ammonia ligase